MRVPVYRTLYGPTGPASTVPGPTGPTGPASTVPGPTGPTGPTGPASFPAIANNTVLGNTSGGAAVPSALTSINLAAITLTNLAALTTPAESWVGPSSTAGVYFQGGNVGIGTTSPGQKLTINNPTSAVLRVQATNSGSSGQIGAYGTGNGGGIFDLGVGATSLWHLSVNDAVGGNKFEINDGTTARIVIDRTNGNVGIGTTSPGSKLAVVGLPTSSAGLSAGDIWVDTTGGLNILKIK